LGNCDNDDCSNEKADGKNYNTKAIKFSIFNLEKYEQIFKSEIKIFSTIENELEQIPEVLKKAGNPPIKTIACRFIHSGEGVIIKTAEMFEHLQNHF